MILKLGMEHYVPKLYKVYINDDSELTLTYFTTMSNFAELVFILIVGPDIRWVFTGPLVLWLNLVQHICTNFIFEYPTSKFVKLLKLDWRWKTVKDMSHHMTKPSKWNVHPAKTQISLCICTVWLEFLHCALWAAKVPTFLQADSKNWSDWVDVQADLIYSWVHRSFSCFCRAVAQMVMEYHYPIAAICRQ